MGQFSCALWHSISSFPIINNNKRVASLVHVICIITTNTVVEGDVPRESRIHRVGVTDAIDASRFIQNNAYTADTKHKIL